MKKLILAVLLIVIFGAGYAALTAERMDQAAVLQGNQLRAAPGYKFERLANNQVRARPASGSLGERIFSCGCPATGTCSINMNSAGDIMTCVKHPEIPCSLNCQWTERPARDVTPR